MVSPTRMEGNTMYKISDEQAQNLLNLMVNLGRRKVQVADAEDVAQISLLKAMQSFDPSKGVTFEQYLIGVVHHRRLNDAISFVYRRKNTKSIDFMYHDENTMDIVDDTRHVPEKIIAHASELKDAGHIDLNEYNIVVMKAKRYKNKEIAKELNLSEGRITQIWDKIQPVLEA